MDALLSLLALNALTWPEVILRVSLTVLCSLILGIDRDRKNKPIDFRAYMIVALTSCLIAIMASEMHASYEALGGANGAIGLDLGKIISGVLSGIGFLGAGAIIKRSDDEVIGTTTGASIWAAGGMGLMFGFGVYGLALLGFSGVAMMLIVSRKLAKPMIES